MAQLTAATIQDVLHWVETTPHHKGSWGHGSDFLTLSSREHRLRIPRALVVEVGAYWEPGGNMDRRMFRANERGRELLSSEVHPLRPDGVADGDGQRETKS